MLLTAAHAQRLTPRLASDLEAVERRFRAELLSDLACVNTLVEHVDRYRGKMLRPMLVLVSAYAVAGSGGGGTSEGDDPSERRQVLATVMEMVHMATLVHDDVLDEANVRRRGATINHLRGNEAAVMLGDYLISHAYHLCSGLGDAQLARRVALATNTVCEGELLQLANRNNWQLDERTYFEVIRRKTASLCGACCELSAALHGADADTARRLGAYGEKLGIAFQIVDDLLDLVGAEQTVGKSLGRDLVKGKLTLPLIRHLQTLSPPQRRRLVQRFDSWSAGAEAFDPHELEAVRREVLGGDAIAYARTRAAELIASAKQAAAALPDCDARACLLDVADKVVDRQS